MPSVHCNNVVNTHFILRRQEYAVVADGNLSAEATPTTEAHTQYLTNRLMGWALKSGASRRVRFMTGQKTCLAAKFRIGE